MDRTPDRAYRHRAVSRRGAAFFDSHARARHARSLPRHAGSRVGADLPPFSWAMGRDGYGDDAPYGAADGTFDFAEREVETTATRAGTVRHRLPRRVVGCGCPPAVRGLAGGLVDRAESYWSIGYFRGIGHCGGMGVDALEATVPACLPSLAIVASRRLES